MHKKNEIGYNNLVYLIVQYHYQRYTVTDNKSKYRTAVCTCRLANYYSHYYQVQCQKLSSYLEILFGCSQTAIAHSYHDLKKRILNLVKCIGLLCDFQFLFFISIGFPDFQSLATFLYFSSADSQQWFVSTLICVGVSDRYYL